jgi:hypothetical protein
VGREGEARLSGHRSISKSILTSRNATTRQVVNKLEDSSMLYLSALKLNLEHFRHIQAVDLMQDLQSRKHELRRTDLSIFCNICGPSLILVYLLTKCRYIFIPSHHLQLSKQRTRYSLLLVSDESRTSDHPTSRHGN